MSDEDERAELVRSLLADGFSEEEVREAERRGRLGLLHVDRVLRGEEACYSGADIARESGLDWKLLVRLWRALGLADTPPEEVAYSEADLDAARIVAGFAAAGLNEEQLTTVGHVLGQTMSRLASTLRETVGEALVEPGMSERTAGLRWSQAVEYLVPQLTPLLHYLLSVQLRELVKLEVVSAEGLSSGRFDNAREVTVCFADLVGFTKLGERVEPQLLGGAEQRLTELASEAARPPVRLVKMIGDAAMLVAPEPEPLVRAALTLVESAGPDMPPLRAGIASGTAVNQRGDWFGAPVNLASRLTAFARPGSVVATRPVRDALRDSFAWSPAGKHRFRGVSGEVPLYRARPPQ